MKLLLNLYLIGINVIVCRRKHNEKINKSIEDNLYKNGCVPSFCLNHLLFCEVNTLISPG